MLNKLKFWYFYNEYGLETASKFLYKYPTLKNQIKSYIKFFDCLDSTIDEVYIKIQSFSPYYKICKNPDCNKHFISKTKKFCSVKCSNSYNTQTLEYKQKISIKTKENWNKLSTLDKTELKHKISQGNKKFYDNESKSDKNIRLKQSLEKSILTCNLRYNKDFAIQNNSILEKSLIKRYNTNLTKYDNIHYFGSETHKEYLDKQKLNKETDYTYVKENFIRNNIFYFEECMLHFGYLSRSTVYKLINHITKDKNIDIKHIELGTLKGKGTYNKELELLNYVESAVINTRRIIPPRELDLYCEKYNFAIEYNGLMFHSYGKSKYSMFNNLDKEDKYYHLRKTELCEEKGIKLLHIFENEYINPSKKNIWLHKIKTEQVTYKSDLYSKSIDILPISVQEINRFFSKNSLENYSFSENNINLGLYCNKYLISTFSFKRIYSECTELIEHTKYEMYYSYSIDNIKSLKITYDNINSVLNTFKEIVHTDYTDLTLYLNLDRRWNSTLKSDFSNLGFKLIKQTEPRLYYFNSDYVLKTEISNVECTDTYRKIYDCGLNVYSKVLT